MALWQEIDLILSHLMCGGLYLLLRARLLYVVKVVDDGHFGHFLMGHVLWMISSVYGIWCVDEGVGTALVVSIKYGPSIVQDFCWMRCVIVCFVIVISILDCIVEVSMNDLKMSCGGCWLVEILQRFEWFAGSYIMTQTLLSSFSLCMCLRHCHGSPRRS